MRAKTTWQPCYASRKPVHLNVGVEGLDLKVRGDDAPEHARVGFRVVVLFFRWFLQSADARQVLESHPGVLGAGHKIGGDFDGVDCAYEQRCRPLVADETGGPLELFQVVGHIVSKKASSGFDDAREFPVETGEHIDHVGSAAQQREADLQDTTRLVVSQRARVRVRISHVLAARRDARLEIGACAHEGVLQNRKGIVATADETLVKRRRALRVEKKMLGRREALLFGGRCLANIARKVHIGLGRVRARVDAYARVWNEKLGAVGFSLAMRDDAEECALEDCVQVCSLVVEKHGDRIARAIEMLSSTLFRIPAHVHEDHSTVRFDEAIVVAVVFYDHAEYLAVGAHGESLFARGASKARRIDHVFDRRESSEMQKGCVLTAQQVGHVFNFFLLIVCKAT